MPAHFKIGNPLRPVLSSFPLPFRRKALVVLIAAVGASSAHAAISDTIHPFVALNYSHDENLFRLDNTGSVANSSDNSKQAQAGFSFDRPIGRQIITGQFKVSRVTFDRNEQLNYNGKEFAAAWQWHLGNHLEGHVGASYNQTLTSFADSHSTERNLRTQRRDYADAYWRFHPTWRVHAGYTRDKYNYALTSQAYNNRTEEAGDVGVDYLTAGGSRIGLLARRYKGIYPNHRLSQGTLIDDSFTQDELKADIYWVLSGVSQIQVLAGWAKREHTFFTGRDASGPNGRAYYYWTPAPRAKLTLSAWRDYSAVESSLVNSSLNRGASLSGTYDISSKMQATANYRRENRDFNKTGGLVFPGDVSDTSRVSSAGLTYVPRQFVQVGVNAYHEKRTSSPLFGSGNYTANGMSVNLTAQF